MTDRADLLRRLEEAADEEMEVAGMFQDQGRHMDASYHEERAALLREAAKALGGE